MSDDEKIECPECGQMVPKSEFDFAMDECDDCVSEIDYAAAI